MAAVTDIPNIKSKCTDVGDDIATIKEWATVFEDIAALKKLVAKNSVKHVLAINKDRKTATDLWKQEKYF